MKATLIAFSLLLLAPVTRAQFVVSTDATYGTFGMGDMEELQKEVASSSVVPLQRVTTFPPYWGYGLSVGYETKKNYLIGIAFNYNSTGGRAYYEDYSGLLRIDQLLTCYSLGGFASFQLNASPKWPILFRMQVSWVQSALDFTTEETLGSSTQTNTLTLTSTNFGFRPMFGLQRNFPKGLFASVYAGYEAQIHGHFFTSGGGETGITAQWDGLRFSAGIGIYLGRMKDSAPDVEEP